MTVFKPVDNTCHNLVHFPIASEKSNQEGLSKVIKKIAKLAFIALAAAFSAAALAGIAFFASSTVVIAISFAVIGAALGGAIAFFSMKEKPKIKKEAIVLIEEQPKEKTDTEEVPQKSKPDSERISDFSQKLTNEFDLGKVLSKDPYLTKKNSEEIFIKKEFFVEEEMPTEFKPKKEEKPKVKKQKIVLTAGENQSLLNAIALARQSHLIHKGLINQSPQEKLKAYKNFVTEIFVEIENIDCKEEKKSDLKREAMHLIKKELTSVIFAAYKKENSQNFLTFAEDQINQLIFDEECQQIIHQAVFKQFVYAQIKQANLFDNDSLASDHAPVMELIKENVNGSSYQTNSEQWLEKAHKIFARQAVAQFIVQFQQSGAQPEDKTRPSLTAFVQTYLPRFDATLHWKKIEQAVFNDYFKAQLNQVSSQISVAEKQRIPIDKKTIVQKLYMIINIDFPGIIQSDLIENYLNLQKISEEIVEDNKDLLKQALQSTKVQTQSSKNLGDEKNKRSLEEEAQSKNQIIKELLSLKKQLKDLSKELVKD